MMGHDSYTVIGQASMTAELGFLAPISKSSLRRASLSPRKMNADPFFIFFLLANLGSGMVRANFGSADRRLAIKAVRRRGRWSAGWSRETICRHDIGPARARPTTLPSSRTDHLSMKGRNAIMNAG